MMRRGLLALSLILFGSVFASTLMPEPAHADACGDKGRILTLKPWYYGLMKDDCSGMKNTVVAKDTAGKGEITMASFITRIVLTIVEDLLHIAGYVAVGFIMFGGFTYLTSGGAPDRAAAGQKTVLNAVIGLVVAMAAIGLINFIGGYLKI